MVVCGLSGRLMARRMRGFFAAMSAQLLIPLASAHSLVIRKCMNWLSYSIIAKLNLPLSGALYGSLPSLARRISVPVAVAVKSACLSAIASTPPPGEFGLNETDEPG